MMKQIALTKMLIKQRIDNSFGTIAAVILSVASVTIATVTITPVRKIEIVIERNHNDIKKHFLHITCTIFVIIMYRN